MLGRGVQGLWGGVAAGVTGVVRTPMQGYSDGTGLMAGEHLLHFDDDDDDDDSLKTI